MDDGTGVLYNGNIFWLLEAMKVVKKDINFEIDFHNPNVQSIRQNNIICNLSSNQIKINVFSI